MEEQKVSVIMSCYNAEKTLARAITSVLNNTYKNIELIIIEDCSTDNSLAIANEFAEKDNRVVVIKHTENLGAGVSRKDGIENSTGDYVCFCDSDDILLEKHIETLVSNSIKYDADIVTSGYIAKDGETDEFQENRRVQEVVILEGENKYAVLKEDVLRFLNPSLIRRRLWDKVAYSTRRFVEDSPTLIKLLWYANKRVVLPVSTYIYYQWNTSLIHTGDDFKYKLYQFLCVKETYTFFTEEAKMPSYVDTNSLMNSFANLFSCKVTEEHKELYKAEIQEIKQFINKLYKAKFE